GWPLGGAFFDPKESMKTLAVSDTTLKAGQLFVGKLPKVGNHAPKAQGTLAQIMSKNFVDDNWAKVMSVVAAKVRKEVDRQTFLDDKSLIDLTYKVQNNTLTWQAPAEGEWQIVVTWSIPSGEKPSLVASPKTNYVIDHLDPAIVNKTYDYMLGDRTGLPAYYGKPLRAIFNDSYEFHTDRITSPDFLEVFKKQHGYDISPYLGSVFQKGYNHPTYLANMYPNAKPPLVFSEANNWRIMYDYDHTVNEVFKQNFIRTSNNWMRKNGLLHRTQAYGFPIDLIGSAGAADIPEAEQLFAEGSEGYLKLVTSGAHLYNRPVITQESFVSILRAEMTTPQKIKIWADKSLAAGINQLIYHGTPYKYNKGEYGKEGWNTWSSPFLPFVNFSTGMNESDPFWKDIKAINQYLARCQYALRSGKPKTDVLIYMPFIDFTENQIAMNPEEILYRGYFKEVEPDIQGFGVFKAPDTPINRWYKALWKTVNELEAKGISWEFVNDESLQKAQWVNGQINIEGNQYQSLILANLPYINLASAKHISKLGKEGMNIWRIGNLPQIQPSFHDFEANDRLVKQLMDEVAQLKNRLPLAQSKINYQTEYTFLRQITREMTDGSQIKFLWNKTDQWQNISLTVADNIKSSYWLNPENGEIENAKGKTTAYWLPPYGSMLFYASTQTAALKGAEITVKTYINSEGAPPIAPLDKWNIIAGQAKLENTALFDWRDKEDFKYQSEEGIYTTTFDLKQLPRQAFLGLGKVYYTAEVFINGQNAGKRLFAPYQLEVQKYLKVGQNKLEIRITTSRRNAFIGEATKKNPHYAQFNNALNTLVPSGLVGPVTLKMRK
ncbi:MAG: glycosyl hydrolase, partial [Spirosomataceae bacterium]